MILSRSVGDFDNMEQAAGWAMSFRSYAKRTVVDATAVPCCEDGDTVAAYRPTSPARALISLCKDAEDQVALVPVS